MCYLSLLPIFRKKCVYISRGHFLKMRSFTSQNELSGGHMCELKWKSKWSNMKNSIFTEVPPPHFQQLNCIWAQLKIYLMFFPTVHFNINNYCGHHRNNMWKLKPFSNLGIILYPIPKVRDDKSFILKGLINMKALRPYFGSQQGLMNLFFGCCTVASISVLFSNLNAVN